VRLDYVRQRSTGIYETDPCASRINAERETQLREPCSASYANRHSSIVIAEFRSNDVSSATIDGPTKRHEFRSFINFLLFLHCARALTRAHKSNDQGDL